MKLASGAEILKDQTARDQRIDAYLARLRRGLAGLSAEKVLDIVVELRGHILEKSARQGHAGTKAVESILGMLGSPEELAAQYLADDLLARAEKRRSPVLLIRGLAHWASMSAAGALVLAGGLLGYFLGGSFMLAGFLKPMHPRTAGLWRLAGDVYSLRLGFGSVPAGGRELLGWWMLPMGLLLGGGLCFLTTQIVLWCVREFRRTLDVGGQ
ncbi:MAG TPA: hypothetical protein VMT67_08090 [Terriglobales bacterium]|nr:hypothetical protein [Terriglobales bacterium]